MTREMIIVNRGTTLADSWIRLAPIRISKVSDAERVPTPDGYSGLTFSVPARDMDIVLEELRRRGYEVTTFHVTK